MIAVAADEDDGRRPRQVVCSRIDVHQCLCMLCGAPRLLGRSGQQGNEHRDAERRAWKALGARRRLPLVNSALCEYLPTHYPHPHPESFLHLVAHLAVVTAARHWAQSFLFCIFPCEHRPFARGSAVEGMFRAAGSLFPVPPPLHLGVE